MHTSAQTTGIEPPSARVAPGEKLAYGAAQTSGIFQVYADVTLKNPIFVVMLGISPTILSLCEVIYRVWDAMTDVVMGWISDRTRSRWGRRRPYIFVGAICVGLWMPMLWMFGRHWSTPAIIAWMIGAYLMLYLLTSIWNIPYQCLLLEMTPDSTERTSIAAWRGYFGKAAVLVISWGWFLTQLPVFNNAQGQPDILRGARWVTLGLGLLVIAFGVLPALFVPERFYHAASQQRKVSLIENFKLTFANRPFMLLAVFTLLFTLGFNVKSGLAFYTRLYYVCGGDQKLAAALGGVEGTITIFTGLAGIPLFQWAAKRYGKKNALMGVMAVCFLAGVSTLFTYTPAYPWMSMLSGLLLAPANTGLWILIPSMTGDIVDFDEWVTGERREGAFAAIYSWSLKLAVSVAAGLSGPAVELAGFRAALGAAQTPTTLLTMRVLLALVPAVFIGAAIWILTRYPLTTRRIAEIRVGLESRRGTV